MKKILCLALLSAQCTTQKTQLEQQKHQRDHSTSTQAHIQKEERIPNLLQNEIIEIPEELGRSIADFNRSLQNQSGSAKASISKKGNKIYIQNSIPGASRIHTQTDKTDTQKSLIAQFTSENTKKVIARLPWWVWLVAGLLLLPRILEIGKLLGHPLRLLIPPRPWQRK